MVIHRPSKVLIGCGALGGVGEGALLSPWTCRFTKAEEVLPRWGGRAEWPP